MEASEKDDCAPPQPDSRHSTSAINGIGFLVCRYLAVGIPHLGIFLGDLTVLDEFDAKIGNKINFRKCRRIAGIIERLLDYQAKDYEFRRVSALTAHVQALPGRLSRKKAMEKSKLVEPRVKKKAK